MPQMVETIHVHQMGQKVIGEPSLVAVNTDMNVRQVNACPHRSGATKIKDGSYATVNC